MGIDLLDFYRGKISLRRLAVIVSCLDNNSYLLKELGKREIGDSIHWDPQTHLVCSILNSTRNLEYLAALGLWSKADPGKRGHQPQAPEPVLPPGYEEPKKPIVYAKPEEVAGFFLIMNEVNNKTARG